MVTQPKLTEEEVDFFATLMIDAYLAWKTKQLTASGSVAAVSHDDQITPPSR
jgi:hypothetical protein